MLSSPLSLKLKGSPLSSTLLELYTTPPLLLKLQNYTLGNRALCLTLTSVCLDLTIL